MGNFFGGIGADSITASGNTGFSPGTLSATDIDVVFGGGGGDTVIGNASNPASLFVFGDSGDDSIVGGGALAGGGAGSQSVFRGNDGNDTLIAGAAGFSQILDGGIGNDSLFGSAQSDILLGEGGADTINGGDGQDQISDTDGANLINAGLGNDTVAIAGAGASSVLGGDGVDLLIAVFSNGGGTLDGEAGNDTVAAGFGNELIIGGLGDDQLDGGHGNNTILGGANSDRINAGNGADSIDGGDFGDHIDGGNGANTINGSGGNDRIFAGFDNDSIIGGANDTTDGGEYIDAHRGNNTVLGGAGGDEIFAGTGNDSIDGQDGSDRIDASDGNNTLFGGEGNDNIFSGFGADTIQGGIGNDVVYSDGGADTVEGNDGNDTLLGGDNTDRLNGGTGNDRLLGEGSNDTLIGSLGSDFLDGSGDTDTVDYSQLGAGISVVIGLQFGFNRVVKRDASGTLGTDTVQGFENFIGTAGDDKFLGWGQDDTFFSTAGNDTYFGNDGSDSVRFDVNGAGNVMVNLLAGTASDGLGGTDRFRKTSATNSDIENITTGGGADTIIGDGDNNAFRGGLGADSLDGGDGFDMVDFLGDSTVAGVRADLSAGAATDSGGATDSIANFENLRGTEAADTLIGNDEGNGIRGHRGADLIDGKFGNDVTDHRNDTDFNGDGFGAIVNLSNGAVTIAGFGAELNVVVGAQRGRDGWGNLDVLTSIESARGTNFNDVLIGVERTAAFRFGGVNFFALDRSFLHGRFGDDELRAVSTGDGVMASYSDDISGIVARLDLGNTIRDGFGNTDTLVNVRSVQGSDFDDLIVAGANGGFFRGRAGNDTITGGAGIDIVTYATAAEAVSADLLIGAAADGDGGADSLTSIDYLAGTRFADTFVGDNDGNRFFGNAGADSLVGGTGEDWVIYHSPWQNVASPIVSGVLVNLGTQTARDGDGSSASGSLDRLVSIEHAVGSHLADTLIGSAGANSLAGAEGDDSINGGLGDDALEGGAGADTLNGGSGIDTVSYAGSSTGVTVSLSLVGVQVSGGDAGGDSLIGFENLTGSQGNDGLTGSAVANLIMGEAGADSIIGAAGDDTLIGGAGNDTMNGGGGADAFRFVSPDEHSPTVAGRDRISDFVSGTDVVQVVGAAFGGLPAGVLAAGRFALNAPADGDDVFIFNTTTKVLSYDADGNGAGLAVQLALMNVATMANTDIIVV